ncbi:MULTISPECIES: non-homologous end-joining DNA ligase [Dermacoccus]|nr:MULTISPECIES: non-homologous end-joining DNA ligase [Dermacoccus]MBO1756988.1 non-homologous end-joining DNA ligase [Dermacoccus sp. NHGro5]MCG7428867.1 non-homologous end-joining DNA ligase [Dermacoccus nishinomiyaensis]
MRPMLATPTPHVPSGPAWRHEVKWDGIRAIVTVRGGEVTIATRSGADCSARFPEITGSHLRDFDDLVLDGEIVALTNGRPDFRAVMHRLAPGGGRSRMRAVNPDEAAILARTPVQLMTFDVLRAAGHDVVTLPWSARRELLDGAGIDGTKGEAGSAIQVPPAHDDGDALLAATRDAGLEGVVSKRVDSPYRPGVRSEDWLKSVHRTRETFVVLGWRPVDGTVGALGAILVGEWADGELVYRGRVGTGFSAAAGRALLEWLTPAPEPAVPRDALAAEDAVGTHWVRPEILIDVTHLGRSAGGRLRQPAYTGLRLDIAAREDDA